MVGINPNFDWQRFGGNTLTDLGAGLTRGKDWQDALRIANEQTQQLTPQRAVLQQQEEEKAARASELNQTVQYLQSKFPDLAEQVAAGMPVGEAWTEALKRSQPQAAPAPIIVNGQLVDATTHQVLGDYRTPEGTKPTAAPSGYRYGADGTSLEFIPGGPADPAVKPDPGLKPTDGQIRASSLAIQIQPDVKTLLGDGKGDEGAFGALGDPLSQAANGLDIFGAKPATGLISSDFKSAKNAATNIAQAYLYAMSGAAAPAEEVRKIEALITPAPFDSEQVKAEKRARVESYITAIEAAAQREVFTPSPAAGGFDVDDLVKKYGF